MDFVLTNKTHTKMEKQKLNLYQKLHRVQSQVIGLGKDTQGNNFKYVSGTKVIDAIKPIMNELGLLLKTEVLSIDNQRNDYATKSNPNKSEILSKVMMKFTWIDIETGEKDECLWGANGQNDWDKGVGSAMTYAERYFLLKYFHIATDEDDIDNPKIDELIEAINLCKTTDELSKIWDNNSRMQTEVKFKQAVILRKKQLEDELIEAINLCKTTDELSKIWEDNVSLQKDAKFTQAVINRKTQIENESK